jgi:hypothetical protein
MFSVVLLLRLDFRSSGWGLHVVARVLDQYSRTWNDFEADCILAGGMEADAHWIALPIGLTTNRLSVVCRIEGLKLFGQHRFARRNLGHQGIETLAARGHSAVGSVVAKLAHLAHAGVVVRQLKGRDSAGNPVNKQPWTTLPDPLPRLVSGVSFVAG